MYYDENMPNGEAQPLPIQVFAKPEVSGKKPEVDPSENERINRAFFGAFNILIGANPDLLPADSALMVVSDPKFKGRDLRDPKTAQEIEADAKTRKEARQKRLNDETILAEVKEISDMPETTGEERQAKQARIEEERQRRSKLYDAVDAVYTAHACEVFIEEAIQSAIDVENRKRLSFDETVETKFITEYKAKYPQASDDEIKRAVDTEVERLKKERPAAVMSKEEVEKFKTDFIARYTDSQGNYRRLDNKGQPILTDEKGQSTSYDIHYRDGTKVLEPIYDAVKKTATGRDADDKPTPTAEKIKPFSDQLEYDERENCFIEASTEDLKAQEIKGDSDEIARQGVIFWGESIRKAIPEEIFDKLFEIDQATEKITGLKKGAKIEDALGEIAKHQEEIPAKLRETIGRLTLFCGLYNDTAIDDKFKPRIAALIYDVLEQSLPKGKMDEIKKGLKKLDRFREVWEGENGILADLIREHKIEITHATRKNLFRDLNYALVFREKLKDKISVNQEGAYQLATGAVDTKSDWFQEWSSLTEAEKQSIFKLAKREGGAIESILTNVFGINVETLQNTEVRTHYVEGLLDKLIPEITVENKDVQEAVKKVYSEVASHSVSDETLKDIAKKKGLPAGVSYGLMLLLIFAPSIQGILGIGLGGEKEESGGG